MPETNRPFNLETMSGVFPGRRTQIFQRVRLQRVADGQSLWGQLQWYDDPPACLVYAQNDAGEVDTPLLRIETTRHADLNQRLQQALAEIGWQMQSCGSCAHWQTSAAISPDQLPVGRCLLRRADGVAVEVGAVLDQQTSLALICPHWQLALPATAAANLHDQHILHSQHFLAGSAVPPLRKHAEVAESKLKFWRRQWRKTQRWLGSGGQRSTQARWQDQLLERSGVGAGTEPCFACQGRIANLGALAVENAEGDKQTFSVWRCRNCFSLYLSDWSDRWERLDNLETEEAIYRLAPIEAAELLTLFATVSGGEHPARRGERHAQRQWINEFMAQRAPLSRQIRQGR